MLCERCAYVKTPKMHSKASVFGTGKMISVGTRSKRQALHDLRHAAEILVEAGLTATVPIEMKIQNIVALADFDGMLDIPRIATNLRGVIYEPEQFPGAILKLKNLKGVTVLLFSSGKAIIAGLKSPHASHSACREILRLIQSI